MVTDSIFIYTKDCAIIPAELKIAVRCDNDTEGVPARLGKEQRSPQVLRKVER
jgi:hypothetical protein